MNNLYLITGPAGVGKSTISNEIAKLKEKSVLIEGDEIYHQVVGGYEPAWKQGNHLQTFWKVCINSIKIYLNDGYDVVFNYIVNPENLKYICEEIKDCNIKFVVLMTDEGTLLYRDNQRKEENHMGERCITLLNSFKKKGYNFRNILNTTNLSIEETVMLIEKDDRFIVE